MIISVIVSCAPGQRQKDRDKRIVDETVGDENRPAAINAKSRKVYRASDFLMQIPNLAASNICMINGLSGASRTLVGNELAGIQGIRMAYNQIRSGRKNIVLVGSSYHGQCFYSNIAMAKAGMLRQTNKMQEYDILPSSTAVFLVMEDRESISKRGGVPLGQICSFESKAIDFDSGLPTFFSEIETDFDCTTSATKALIKHEYADLHDKIFSNISAATSVEEHLGFMSEAMFPAGMCLALSEPKNAGKTIDVSHIDRLPSFSCVKIEVSEK